VGILDFPSLFNFREGCGNCHLHQRKNDRCDRILLADVSLKSAICIPSRRLAWENFQEIRLAWGERINGRCNKPMMPDRRAKKRTDRKDSLQRTRYPITNLELIFFVILVLTFIALAFLCISLPWGEVI
jgi:hypothetical protein